MSPLLHPLPAAKSVVLCAIVSAALLAGGCDSSSTDNSDTTATDTDDSTGANDNTDGTDTTTDTDNTDASGAEAEDIYNAIFTERSPDCGDYVNEYDAMPLDIKNDIAFDADVFITATDTECTLTSNSIPNHDFNDETAAFAGGAEGATIAATDLVHTVTRNPEFASEPTYITQQIKNAIFLNGVRLDIMSAGCYRPNSADANEDGDVGIGCDSNTAWLLDPLSTESKFGADFHNAHTQPGGLYHYHGGPNAMFDDNPGPDGSPVIGFAADGFPIYGSYFFDDNSGQLRKAISGYTLKTGSRGTRSDTNPGGEYTGKYNDDWEYTGAGDLDECNGMTVNDQYGYYVTDAYPWVIKCLRGTPDDSFVQTGATGGPPQR